MNAKQPVGSNDTTDAAALETATTSHKTSELRVRVTPGIYAMTKKTAAARGLSVADYIRTIVFSALKSALTKQSA